MQGKKTKRSRLPAPYKFRDDLPDEPVVTSLLLLWCDMFEQDGINPYEYLMKRDADQVKNAMEKVIRFVEELEEQGLIVIEY